MKMFLLLLVLIFLIVPVNATDWHDDSRLKRVQLNVNNSSVALADYQIIKTVAYDSDMQPDFDDILFYNESGTNIPYWIESKSDGVTADVWLKIPSISTTEGAKVWMYYGNSGLSSGSSIDDTFIFGDDFSSINSSKWTTTGTPTVSTSWLQLDKSDGIWATNQNIVDDTTTTFDIRFSGTTGYCRADYVGTAWKFTRDLQSGQRGLTNGYWSGANAYAERAGTSFAEHVYTTYPATEHQSGYVYQAGTSAKLYVGETSYTETTTARIPTVGDNVHIHAYNAPEGTMTLMEIDWVHVRKYTATEPTWAADGEEESNEVTIMDVYNLTVINKNNITTLQNDVDDLENNVNNLYMFVLLCTVFLAAALRKRREEQC